MYLTSVRLSFLSKNKFKFRIDIGGNIHILKEFIDSENSEAIFSPTVHKLNDFSVLIKGQSLHKFAINNELSQ